MGAADLHGGGGMRFHGCTMDKFHISEEGGGGIKVRKNVVTCSKFRF